MKKKSASIQSQGGKARADKLSPEKRKEIAQRAAASRWKPDLPQVSHEGSLSIGGIDFKCGIIESDNPDIAPQRVISQSEFMKGLGMYYSGFIANQKKKKESDQLGTAEIPMFLAQAALRPFIEKNLSVLQFKPFEYRTAAGAVAKGIPAQIIPKICEVWIDANRAGVLGARQTMIAEKAEILHRGLAEIGIVALVDEVTGYQKARARDALQVILDSFLRKEFAAWAKRFPDQFYQEIYRLRGWVWPGMSKNRYPLVGKLTKDLVYERLAPKILEDLEKKNPKDQKGNRKTKHHMWLTDDIGHPALQQHIHALLGLMRACDDYKQFKKLVDRAFPKKDEAYQLELIMDA